MINANELRIGNWVQDEHGCIQYVYRIWKGGCELAADEGGREDIDFREEELFGVPLTPDILVACGFRKENNGWKCADYKNNVNEFSIYDYGGYYQFNSSTPPNPNIEYLHQLQNLYFALTGKDLEVKL